MDLLVLYNILATYIGGIMQCPECGSENCTVSLVQSGEVTKKSGVGIGGHANNAARAATAVMTLGLSNLAWKKSKGVNKTKAKNVKIAVCQDCGNSWEIK
jgi:GTP cyclohydrolase III